MASARQPGKDALMPAPRQRAQAHQFRRSPELDARKTPGKSPMKLTQEVDFLQERQVPAPCQLWVREEAFREGVIQCDLLRLSSKGPSANAQESVSMVSPLESSVVFPKPPQFTSPLLVRLMERNKTSVLRYSSWLTYAKEIFGCNAMCARMYFELFQRIHTRLSVAESKPELQAVLQVDICEFMLFLYLQQQWPRFLRKRRSNPRRGSTHSRSKSREERQMRSSDDSYWGPEDTASDTGGNVTDSDDDEKDMGFAANGTSSGGSSSADESGPDRLLIQFLHVHLTNLLLLVRDPHKQLQLRQQLMSRESEQKGTSSAMSVSSDQVVNTGDKPKPPTHGDVPGGGNMHVTLRKHEFDRLGFLLFHDFRPTPVQQGQSSVEVDAAANKLPLALGDVTPYWRTNAFMDMSLSALREWVLRHLHAVPRRTSRVRTASSREVYISSTTHPLTRSTGLLGIRDELVVLEGRTLRGGDCRISGCYASSIYLPSSTRFVSVNDCCKCTLHLGLASVLLNIGNCSDVVVYGVAKAVQIRNVTNSQLFLYSMEPPVLIGGNSNLTFAPYNTYYPSLVSDMYRLHFLPDLRNNCWDRLLVALTTDHLRAEAAKKKLDTIPSPDKSKSTSVVDVSPPFRPKGKGGDAARGGGLPLTFSLHLQPNGVVTSNLSAGLAAGRSADATNHKTGQSRLGAHEQKELECLRTVLRDAEKDAGTLFAAVACALPPARFAPSSYPLKATRPLPDPTNASNSNRQQTHISANPFPLPPAYRRCLDIKAERVRHLRSLIDQAHLSEQERIFLQRRIMDQYEIWVESQQQGSYAQHLLNLQKYTVHRRSSDLRRYKSSPYGTSPMGGVSHRRTTSGSSSSSVNSSEAPGTSPATTPTNTPTNNNDSSHANSNSSAPSSSTTAGVPMRRTPHTRTIPRRAYSGPVGRIEDEDVQFPINSNYVHPSAAPRHGQNRQWPAASSQQLETSVPREFVYMHQPDVDSHD